MIMIIGHQRIVKFFENAEKEGALSHAYGFIGPGSVGKRTVAKKLASTLLKTPEEKLFSHPDFIYMERGEDEKTGKLKKEITVNQAREIRSRLQTTSWQEGYRVVIINEAEKLNNESASALLKILEEPPKRSIFLLLVENEAALIPTIKSRIQTFYFSLVKPAEVAVGLREMGADPEKAELFARRCLGKPGLAINFLQEDFSDKYSELLKTFQEMVGAPFYRKLQLVENYFGDKEDGERGRQELQKILDNWIAWFRDSLLKKHGASEFSSEPLIFTKLHFSDSQLLEIIDSLINIKKLLSQNVHPRLAVETALIKF